MSQARDLRVYEEIEISAPPEAVFRALTNPVDLTAWWSIPGQYETRHAEVDLRVGGRYRLSGTSVRRRSFTVEGEYLVIDPPERLSYTWTPDWDDDARGSIVDIRLKPTAAGTRVRVTHSAFSTAAARDAHRQGWPGVLVALKRHVDRVSG